MGSFSLGDAALSMLGGAADVYNQDVQQRKAEERAQKAANKKLADARDAFKWQTNFKAKHAKKVRDTDIDDNVKRGGGYGTVEGDWIAVKARGLYDNSEGGYRRYMMDRKAGKINVGAYSDNTPAGQPTVEALLGGEI